MGSEIGRKVSMIVFLIVRLFDVVIEKAVIRRN